ncbi:MAG: GNAT family N-acetyltransferase [Clostridiales bacterium]|nr:GNAT family N-acetyltransferase [Clostridiales bacterium]
MSDIEFRWTNGNDKDFQKFYLETEEYYSKIVGGKKNRTGFIPYNLSESISDVLIATIDGTAVGCAGLKKYSSEDVEIKRVWVEPGFRGNHIASRMMDLIEEKAREMGFKRAVLQTRPIMEDAVGLYEKRGYSLIENYPPYDQLEGAICMALDL